jgi:hypothetical protein
MDSRTINSVLGFDFNVEIRDNNGELVKTGCRSCVAPVRKARIKSKILDKKFFTTFNEPLLAKIRNLRNNS